MREAIKGYLMREAIKGGIEGGHAGRPSVRSSRGHQGGHPWHSEAISGVHAG